MTHTDFNQLLSSVKSLSAEQARRLRQQLDRQLGQAKAPAVGTPTKAAKRAKPAAPKKKLLTRDEFNRHLLEIGLISALPDPARDLDDDDPADQPVAIKNEPLSETIIRERR